MCKIFIKFLTALGGGAQAGGGRERGREREKKRKKGRENDEGTRARAKAGEDESIVRDAKKKTINWATVLKKL